MKSLSFMGMIRRGRELKSYRSKWRTDWKIHAEVDWRWISVFPSICWTPWFERFPKSWVIEIHWLGLHIGIGEFDRRKDVSTDDDV